SPWEGHPNERSNQVYAAEFLRVLERLPALQPYRRATSPTPGDRASESKEAGAVEKAPLQPVTGNRR
ncbi:MAG TPA: hypothetical protein VN648_24115, partial [Candidatus Methylomirabilis sp.]|nr:hypothetical protein [Candidatus Methylomirabilis sp.]